MDIGALRENRKAIFDHIRNILICSTLLVVSAYTGSHPQIVFGTDAPTFGVVLAVVLFITTVLLFGLVADEALDILVKLKSRATGAVLLPLYVLLVILVGKSAVALKAGLNLGL